MQAADYIKQLYSEHPKPLYLSKLGGILKGKGIVVNNLRELVESMDGFTVACGPEKERTAIAAVDDKEEIEALLNNNAKKIDNDTLKFLSKIPRTLLFAFGSKSKARPKIYVMNSYPYKYALTKDDDESMVEIQSSLLLDAKIPVNLKQLDPDIAAKLFTNIKKWIEDNKIELTAYVKNMPKSHTGDQITLLEEMINAIPANQRSKVALPLDIIGYLIKKR